MKTVILLVATYAALATSSAVRDKRSWTHTQAYPVSVHSVVRPSNTLPVYEYPESTEIHTQANTVYSVSVPITHTVHLEQPEHSRQIVYHNPPTTYYNNYNTLQSPVYNVPQYTPQVYTPQVYSPTVYTAPTLQRRVYNVVSPWPYRRYANTWC